MTTSGKTKIVQYLNEAHAMEVSLVRVLQEQIAMTPRGSYLSALEIHVRETRSHADRIARRRAEVQGGRNPIGAIVGMAQDAVGQALSLAKAPLDIMRGSGGEEKVLKNAKDAYATEALEIATYIALEHLARALDDDRTAELAISIREDEEAMLERIERELPALVDAVVSADIEGRPSYDVAKTGAADAVRDAAQETKQAVHGAAQDAKRATRQARRVPGVEQAEGAAKGAVASDEDLPIPDYDDLTAEEIVARLRDGDDALAARVRDYERAHKDRATVLRAAERELSHA